MSPNTSQINRLAKEIANLRAADAKEASKESPVQSRINRANETIQKTANRSATQSKLREVERSTKELAGIQQKRAGIAKKIADKTKLLSHYESQRNREEECGRKKAADEQKRLFRERERHERQVTSEMRSRKHLALGTHNSVPVQSKDFPVPVQRKDFFISHASEDKDSFVRELAVSLEQGGASVWYDEFTLKVGDSLRREIDRGLANSTFGIVVLSTHFFAKEWPQRELDGLIALDTEGSKRILPIWHEITKDVVLRHSPMLADRVALNTSLKTVDEITSKLLDLVLMP